MKKKRTKKRYRKTCPVCYAKYNTFLAHDFYGDNRSPQWEMSWCDFNFFAAPKWAYITSRGDGFYLCIKCGTALT